MEEKRISPRFESFFEVKYSTKRAGNRPHYTVSKNVSVSGLSMPVLSSYVSSNDTLNLVINTNDKKGPISATGRVKWARRIERPAMLDQEVGIEFTKISTKDTNRILDI